jgi:hypothetical protein
MQWGGGSDFFVTPFAARYGIWSSITRQPLLGVYGHDAFGQDQSVDVKTALRSYTIWAAHQMFLEDKIGSIEVGKYADIAVWDTDLYRAAPDAIKNMECQMGRRGGVPEAGLSLGLDLSILSLGSGCNQFGQMRYVPRKDIYRLVRRALDFGINYFDAASRAGSVPNGNGERCGRDRHVACPSPGAPGLSKAEACYRLFGWSCWTSA